MDHVDYYIHIHSAQGLRHPRLMFTGFPRLTASMLSTGRVISLLDDVHDLLEGPEPKPNQEIHFVSLHNN